MKKFIVRFLAFILLPLFTFEIIFRIIPYPVDFYFSKTDPFYEFKKVKERSADSNIFYMIFIGSSHVAAAVADEEMNRQLSGRNVRVINAGRGSTSSAIFFLGLKELAEMGLLNNTLVFLEAPEGLSSYYDNYKGSWVNDQNIHYLVPYLNAATFFEFWKYSDNTISVKSDLSINYLMYSFRIASMIKRIFKENHIEGLIKKFTSRFLRPKQASGLQSSVIAAKGGIRTSPQDIMKAREIAYAYFDDYIPETITEEDWKHSRLHEIMKLLRMNGSDLILFKMPVSSVESTIYNTEKARENIRNFHNYLRTEKIRYMDFDFSDYTDDDFPDLWHLSYEKSSEFSSNMLNRLYNQNLIVKKN